MFDVFILSNYFYLFLYLFSCNYFILLRLFIIKYLPLNYYIAILSYLRIYNYPYYSYSFLIRFNLIFYSFLIFFNSKIVFNGKGYYIFKNKRNTFLLNICYSYMTYLYLNSINIYLTHRKILILFSNNCCFNTICYLRFIRLFLINVYTNNGFFVARSPRRLYISNL